MEAAGSKAAKICSAKPLSDRPATDLLPSQSNMCQTGDVGESPPPPSLPTHHVKKSPAVEQLPHLLEIIRREPELPESHVIPDDLLLIHGATSGRIHR